VIDTGPDLESRVIACGRPQGDSGGDGLQQAAFRALARVASALVVRHGLVGAARHDRPLATDIACNSLRDDELGRMIEPMLHQAPPPSRTSCAAPAAARGHDTKGASASGKSTLRLCKRASRAISASNGANSR